MKTLTNFVLGAVLAAVLIGPVAWARTDQPAPAGISIATAGLLHMTGFLSVSTTLRSALLRTR